MMSFILSISKRSQTCVNTNCARNAWSPEVSSNCAFKSMKSEPTEPTKRWWFASQRLNQMMSIVFALISQAERGRLATFIADEGIEDSLFRDVKPVTWCHMFNMFKKFRNFACTCHTMEPQWFDAKEIFDLVTNWEPVFQQFIGCQQVWEYHRFSLALKPINPYKSWFRVSLFFRPSSNRRASI